MARPEIYVFHDLGELSSRAATRFVDLAGERLASGQIFTAALSGGSTPKPLYELLANTAFSDRIHWERVHLFQVDERCVSPDSPDSNYRMIRECLLDRQPAARENFHRMQAERKDLDLAAREYASEIGAVLRPGPGEWPRFDLLLLGMGPDGHTASLFPGSPALAETSRWVCPNYVAKLRAYRLTLTFPVINAAAEIVFLVAGNDKAEPLRQVLDSRAGIDGLPAQRVRPRARRVNWFIDSAAARLIASEPKAESHN
jgi:6-phosphogluconolactonase